MCLHLAALTRDSIQFDMKHKHVLKKLNFDLLTQPQCQGGLRVKIFATILLHASFP